MGKYDPLAEYLRRRRQTEVLLTFRDVERIIGDFLPKAANEPGWWGEGAAADAAAPQTRAWTSVHFRPEVDLRGERVRFVREDPVAVGAEQPIPTD